MEALSVEQDKQVDVADVINKLCKLNADNPVDWSENLNELCQRNIQSIGEIPDLKEIALKKYNPDDNSQVWKYICVNFHYLLWFKRYFESNADSTTHFSVQQTNQLKNVIRNVIGVGIAANLLPTIPYYVRLPSDENLTNPVDVFTRYKRLVGTTFGIYVCFKCSQLKPLILPNIKWILSAFYQIVYCPLKKPNNLPSEDGFVMTEDIYNSLLEDKQSFKHRLKDLTASVHVMLCIRETMMLAGTFSSRNKAVNAPIWMRKAVYSNLGFIIRSPKGVENIAGALLDAAGLDSSDDSTKSWQTLDIIAKMIVDYRKMTDFRENVCQQLKNLLKVRDRSGQPVAPFERLFSLCVKLLFQQDERLCREVFVRHLLAPLICYTDEERNFTNNENITDSVSQTLRLLHSLIVEHNFNIPALPVVHELTATLNVLFHVYAAIFDISGFEALKVDIKAIFLKVLCELEGGGNPMFDSFLFGMGSESVSKMRGDVEFLAENNCLIVKLNKHISGLRPLRSAEVLQSLVKQDLSVSFKLYNYLLHCLANNKKYFQTEVVNRDLLWAEDEFILDDCLERKCAIHKLLFELSERKDFQKYISENPATVISSIKFFFARSIENGVHRNENQESEEFNALFIIASLLEILIENSSQSMLNQCDDLVELLKIIVEECGITELQNVAKGILSKLIGTPGAKESAKNDFDDVLDKALEDLCDPLIPVRGHALMTITKLVEKKDKSALERKHYLLNIFQLNLKNEESYIYLSAVGGLAAMGDMFPDTVLNVLAEEYTNFLRKGREDGHEVRMKVGEVLVRVTKTLGDMAPKYKSLLLNTFLVGTKDEDHLIRASSLSNLGEVCRVLGYKLGSIVTEVLVCVHAIITTDKAVEARRAAVTVIRQLFVGLEKETVVFLKDEILPVYRTLKHIYYHDPDDVMRLQAQVALEELNENVRGFIFPQPQLHTEKKFVILG